MLTKIIAEVLVNDSNDLINKASKIAIITHISPDGDAIGSALGLYHFLYSLNKESIVIVPNRYASFFNWMPAVSQILIYDENKDQIDKLLLSCDLMILTDFNTNSRIGQLKEAVEQFKGEKILIDHHRNPDIMANVIISYPTISSTSELVFRLISRMGFFETINKPCATAIYTGMMTDTGAFTFNSNNPEIYFIISELLTKGIDKDQIYNNIYNTYSTDRLRLMGYTLSEKMEVIPEYKTAIITLTNEELKRYHYQDGDTEGFVNLPLSIKGIVFSVLIKENTNNVKLSLRSRGLFPVNQVAATYFHGGGHINAAGGESYESLNQTVDQLKQVLPLYKELLEISES
jgi:phosphoesterase RecJ-like protein